MNPEVVLSDKQREAVQSSADMVIVAAAAGSGKTRVLTEKIIFEVLERSVPIHRIAAITYTNKAADEMRIRLMEGFKQRGRADLARQVHHAQIMTIHAFALEILKKYSVDASLDPGFGIIEDIDYQIMLDRAVNEALSDISRNDSDKSSALNRFAEHHQIKKALKTAYEEWGTSGIHPHSSETAQSELDERVSYLLEMLTETAQEHQDGLIDMQRLRNIKNSAAEGLFEQLVLLLSEIQSSGKRYLTPIKEECRSVIALAADREASEVKKILIKLIEDIHRRAEDIKQQLNRISINDQISKLIEIMDNTEVADEVSGLYDWVMVDEFQDVNPVQYKLIIRIASRSRKFFVGDVRQSIYGFRHADCSIFAGLNQYPEENSVVIDLDENYRSSPDLINRVNQVYGKESCYDGLPFGCVVALKHPDPQRDLFSIELNEEKLSPQEYRLSEARYLARMIADSGSKNGTGTHAILLRSMRHAFLYAEALKSEGISSRIIGSGGFYECREIMDVISLLRWAKDHQDAVALAAVLRSPWINLSEATFSALAFHREGFVKAVLTASPESFPESDRKSLLKLRVWKDQFKERLNTSGLAAFCEWCIRFFDIRAVLSSRASGEILTGNINKLTAIIRNYAESSSPDLKGMLERFQMISESSEVREAEFDPHAGDETAVQIMSIHKSKGLEFDAVYIPDKESKTRPDAGHVFYLNRNGEVVVSVPDPLSGDRIKTHRYTTHMDHIKKIQSEEKNRLYYVAMTRAKNRLVILGNHVPPKNSKKDVPDDFISLESLSLKFSEFIRRWSAGQDICVSENTGHSDSQQERVAEAALEAANWILPGSDLDWLQAVPASYPSPLEMTATQISELWNESAPVYSVKRSSLISSSDYGNVFHEVMQHYNFASPGDYEVRRLIREFGRKLDIDSEKRLHEELVLFSESPLAAELMQAETEGGRTIREFSFVIRLSPASDAGSDPVIIKGQADILRMSPDGKWCLIDYKSGQMHAAYTKQLELYAFCLERVSAIRFDSARLYFSQSAEMYDVDLSVARAPGYADQLFQKIRLQRGAVIQSMTITEE